MRLGVQGFVGLGDGNDDDLDGGQFGGEHEAFIVAVGHDQATDEAGGDAPAAGPDVFFLVVGVAELDVEGFGKVLAQVVAGTGL